MKQVYISLGVNLIIIAGVIALHSFLPPVVPLFYGRAIGERQLVNSYLLVLPSVVSIFFTIFNFWISNHFFKKDSFLRNILSVSSFFINLLVAITVVRIILLVGFFR